MLVARTEANHGQDTMADELAALLVRGDPDAGQFGQHHLLEHERLVVVHRIDRIVADDARPELLAHGVGGQAEHVDLHIRADLLITQKLSR